MSEATKRFGNGSILSIIAIVISLSALRLDQRQRVFLQDVFNQGPEVFILGFGEAHPDTGAKIGRLHNHWKPEPLFDLFQNRFRMVHAFAINRHMWQHIYAGLFDERLGDILAHGDRIARGREPRDRNAEQLKIGLHAAIFAKCAVKDGQDAIDRVKHGAIHGAHDRPIITPAERHLLPERRARTIGGNVAQAVADPEPVGKIHIDGQHIDRANIDCIHQLVRADDANIVLGAGAPKNHHSFQQFCQFFTSLKS